MDKETLEGLAGLLNQPAEAIESLFEKPEKEGDPAKLKSSSEIISTFQGWVAGRINDISKQAKAREWSILEKWVKSQGFDSDKQGTDLLTDYSAHLKATAKGDGSDGEWEKKFNELFPKLENLQRALAEKEAAIEQAKRDAEHRVIAARLETDLRRALGTKWAGTDEHFALIRAQFSADRIKYEGDTPVLLNDKGEALTDELHRPVKFSDRVQALGKLAGGFHAVDPGKGGAGNQGGGTGGGGNGITLPQGLGAREFQAMLAKETDPAKRADLMAARKAQIEK